MMDCNELVELVTDYLEGRMAPDDVRRFDAHIAECEGCAIYLDQIRAAAAVTGRLTSERLPSGAADALLVQFREWKAAR